MGFWFLGLLAFIQHIEKKASLSYAMLLYKIGHLFIDLAVFLHDGAREIEDAGS